jgi:hypothetical protein
MTEKIPAAKLDFDKGDIEFIDAKGDVIEEPKVEEDSKAFKFLKKAVMLTPVGMSYTFGKTMFEKGGQIFDKVVNENELNRVENIRFEDILSLIDDGQDKFDELKLNFNSSQANGFSAAQLKSELAKRDFTATVGKRGDFGLEIQVKYK